MLRKFTKCRVLLSTDALLQLGRTTSAIRCFRNSPAQLNRQEESPSSPTLRKIEEQLAADKKELEWRTPAHQRTEEWNTKLKLFESEDQNSDYIIFMQKPIDLSPKSIKNWWQNKQEKHERFLQQYIPDRHAILGPDLATAHFLMYRGGAVKFTSSSQWIKAENKDELNLPNRYDPAYRLQAMRCDDLKLYYEGLENLRCLDFLKFLSFRNVKTFDDWCLDRVSGSQYISLEVLDISGTKCTVRGLSCLYRIPSLKLLIIDNPQESLEYELTCAMLEECIPALKICGADSVHGTPEDA